MQTEQEKRTETLKPTTSWGRVGHVFYWASLLAGLVLAILFAVAAAPLGLGWQIAYAAGGFIVCYLAGRAFRYVLAGR